MTGSTRLLRLAMPYRISHPIQAARHRQPGPAAAGGIQGLPALRWVSWSVAPPNSPLGAKRAVGGQHTGAGDWFGSDHFVREP